VADGMGGGGEWMVKILIEDSAEMEGKRAAHVTQVSVSARCVKEVAGKFVCVLGVSSLTQLLELWSLFPFNVSITNHPAESINVSLGSHGNQLLAYHTLHCLIAPKVNLHMKADPYYKGRAHPM
jgi:hypothetical protein